MSNYGQGAITPVNANNAGGGGGTVNAAQNATSIVGGNTVELGLNPLLHDTAFDLDNFNFLISNLGLFGLYLQGTSGSELAALISPGINQITLLLNDASQTAEIDDTTASMSGLFLDFLNDNYTIGDVNQIVNGMRLIVDDFNKNVTVKSATGIFLDIDVLNANYQLGDIFTTNNGVILNIEDSVNDANIQNAFGTFLDLDMANGIYKLGDISGHLNANRLIINDAAQIVEILNATKIGLNMNFGTNEYGLGDTADVNNGTRILIDDAGKSFVVYGSPTNQRLLALTEFTQNYSFGDLDVIANGNRMEIDDAAGTFNFVNAANGVIFRSRPQGIETLPPTGGGGKGEWQLGQRVAAVVAFDATQYIQVNIDGVLYKLALAN